ncbi:MAG: hypothetical protein KAW92_13755, partial [Candidatus Cloacimonetes bacterium]|nr:hypothetical protein [Candidatus Cloacimonadota bacterium]
MKCNKCQLFKTCKKPCIQGVGPVPADIMLVGMNPGADEDEKGVPFVGAAGKRLNIMLKATHLERRSLFITNTVRCKTPDNREPTEEEIKACSPYLEEEIKEVKPKIIVPLGNIALQYILNLEGITKWAGTRHWSKKYNCWIIPTYHPAYICRALGLQGVMVDHLKNIVEWLKNPIEPKPPKYVVANTMEKAKRLFKRLNEVDIFSFDTETSGLDFRKDKILCCSFSWKERTGVVLPILQQHCKEFWKPEEKKWIINQLKKVLEGNIHKIGQNLPFDIQFLKTFGIKLNNYMFDTMLAHHLLDENVGREGHGLTAMVLRYFPDMGKYDERLSKYLTTKNTSYAVIPNDVLWKYAAADADATFRCYKKFKPELEKQGLMRLFNKITIPFQKALLETEYNGVRLDVKRLEELEVEYSERLKKIEEEFRATDTVKETEKMLYDKAAKKIEKRYDNLKTKPKTLTKDQYIKKHTKPITFNLRSSQQLQILLFDVLKLKPIKTTEKGGRSTDAEVLNTLAKESPELVKLKEHRDLSKLLSTYVVGMLKRVDENGRIHTDYHVDGTVTGRLASSNPNLQNIPRDSEIKECFIPDPEYVLLEADFAQAEYRCWAHYSNDKGMIKDIKDGKDVHKQMASTVGNKEVEKVTKKERQQSKTVVFGIIYGRGAKSLAAELGITEEKAQNIIKAFFDKYPKAKEWIFNVKKEAQKGAKVVNVFGRIRRLPAAQIPWSDNMEKHDRRDRSEAMRFATNSPIQSMAADITAITAVRIQKRLKQIDSKVRLVLTVHDSLIYEVPKKEKDNLIQIIKEEVARGYTTINGPLRVPMNIDISVGERWGKLVEI